MSLQPHTTNTTINTKPICFTNLIICVLNTFSQLVNDMFFVFQLFQNDSLNLSKGMNLILMKKNRLDRTGLKRVHGI